MVKNQNGAGGKNKSGGGSVTITKSVARKTVSIDDTIVALRQSLFNDDGSDRDVCEKLKPFMKYDRQGLDIEIKFAPKLKKKEKEWAFELIKSNMEERYDASGYGWDDEDKERELTEDGARFLLCRWADDADSLDQGELCAIAHFRFSVQGEFVDEMCGDSCLIVWDLHVEEDAQRKGLGKHLLSIMELVAKQQNLSRVYIPVLLEDDITLDWVEKVCEPRGYAPDDSLVDLIKFDAEMEGFQPYAKMMDAPKPAAAAKKAAAVSAPASVFTAAAGAGAEAVAEADKEPVQEDVDAEDADEVARKIALLKEMYSKKFGTEPTDEELNVWIVSVAEKEAEEAGEA